MADTADGLRIFGQIINPLEATTPVGPEPTQVEDEDMPEEDLMQEGPQMGGGMVSPESARYFGPDSRCKNCIHFMEPASCEIVSGSIDPDGICSLFTQDSEEDMSLEIGEDNGTNY